jgi:hypothetical protein
MFRLQHNIEDSGIGLESRNDNRELKRFRHPRRNKIYGRED